MTVKAKCLEVVRWKNVFLQALHLGLGGVFVVGLWMILGRSWGVQAFGTFNYLYTLAGAFGITIDFGLDILLTRIVASGRSGVVRQLIWIKAVVLLLALLVFVPMGLLSQPDHGRTFLTLVIGVTFLSMTTLCNGLLRGLERLDVEALIGLGQKVVFVVASGLGVLVFDCGLVCVAAAYMGSHVAGFLVTLKCIPSRDRFVYRHKSPLQSHFREVLPLWGVTVLLFLSLRLDIFLLQWLSDDTAVGIFTAGFRFIEGFVALGMAYMAACLPRLVVASRDPESFSRIAKRSAAILGGFGVAVFVGCLLFGTPLVVLLFGSQFTQSAFVLTVLAASLPFLYVSVVYGQALIAIREQRLYVTGLSVAIVVGAGIGVVLIPLYGVLGGLAAFSLRSVTACALLWLFLKGRL